MDNLSKDIVVVGSVAFDDIETIKGKKNRLLGGSGLYFSIASSLYTKTHLIGIVGDDFDQKYIDMLHSKSISTDYLIKEMVKHLVGAANTVLTLIKETHYSQI